MKHAFLIIPLIFIFFFFSCNQSTNQRSYEEKVQTVEEIEKIDPIKFLKVTGTYRDNFWGTKVVLEGNITNKATVASYKDVNIQVIFYSKTDTEITRKDYVIYEKYSPNQSRDYKLKVDKFSGTSYCRIEVIGATPI